MRFSYLIVGLFTDHSLFIDISPAPVVILVSDLPPLSAPLLMCGISKKALHLNLQGSFFDPISSALSRLLFSCKPQKERMNKKDYNKKNVSRNMELLFQTKSKFYDYLLSLVIIPQMSRQFQLLKMKTDLLYFLFFFFFHVATVMDIVDASPQSTIRSWTCSDVKTWPKNERQVSSTVYIILNPIPKALSDLKYCHSPLGK